MSEFAVLEFEQGFYHTFVTSERREHVQGKIIKLHVSGLEREPSRLISIKIYDNNGLVLLDEHYEGIWIYNGDSELIIHDATIN